MKFNDALTKALRLNCEGRTASSPAMAEKLEVNNTVISKTLNRVRKIVFISVDLIKLTIHGFIEVLEPD